MDAILAVADDGTIGEPEWPDAEVIIGNPPFLGGKRLRSELGDEYVNRLFAAYDGRVPREADLVVYWFERARELIQARQGRRAGLLATNSIRGGANRRVLQRVKEAGDIFWPGAIGRGSWMGRPFMFRWWVLTAERKRPARWTARRSSRSMPI